MILPNKVATFDECVLAKTIYILKIIEVEECSVSDLFLYSKNNFEDINEFITALDVLYILKKITYDNKKKVIQYVKEDNM